MNPSTTLARCNVFVGNSSSRLARTKRRAVARSSPNAREIAEIDSPRSLRREIAAQRWAR